MEVCIGDKVMSKSRKKRIFDIIQIGNDEDRVSRGFDILIMAVILINLFLAVFETFENAARYQDILNIAELVTVIIFTVEYILRVWTSDYLYSDDENRWRAVLRYVLSFSGIVDLLSFLPYYLPVFFPAGIVAFRMFRVIRILRLFRINAYYDAFNVITNVLKNKRQQLISSVFIILVLMLASSLCMYSLEHEAQPEVFRNAFSGFWWAVSTLLTVGYGDIYPITMLGRLFGICITMLGVGMVAIPTGILSAGFVEQYAQLKEIDEDTKDKDKQYVLLEMKEDSLWTGMKIRNMMLPAELKPVIIRRGERTIEPSQNLIIRAGDILVLAAEGCEE